MPSGIGRRRLRAAVSVNATSSPVRVAVQCENCRRGVELECEGVSGVAGYEIYQEYFCPYCRKVNRPKTPGHILLVRAAGWE
jgi:hypothetical protein